MLNIIFLWDNFGPTHADRCEAVAKDLGGLARVIRSGECRQARNQFSSTRTFSGKADEMIK